MAPSHSGRILALDYGRKRIGLAISDELRSGSTPFAIFVRKNRADDLRRLRRLVRENRVCQLVVGLPLHLDGADSEMAAETRSFAARLRKHLGLPVELLDERLTSWEAKNTRVTSTRAANPRENSDDDVAAAILLRDYLARREKSLANSKTLAKPPAASRRATTGKS